MRIEKEDDLLDIEKRVLIIKDIQSSENQGRKDEAYKRYLCLKDKTKDYVVKELLKQFDGSTVEEMSYCISNISVTKKIIDKLARVYANGVKRTVPDQKDLTTQIEKLSTALELNQVMKKVNRFLKLHKNVALFVKPVPSYDSDDGDQIFSLKLMVLAPYLYDVVEQYHDRERALCYVLSHYSPMGGGANSLLATNVARAGRAFLTPTIKPAGDGRDETIAGAGSDDNIDKKEYIFWSDKYHFTCNEKGEIIKSEIGDNNQPNPENPIGLCPIQEFAIEQDGTFWAQGGDDIVDGGILINSLITNLNHIGITQGYGQFYMSGKNLPKQIKLGPNKAITMEVDTKDDPEPKIGFANANAPLQELQKSIEMYAALLLTTNNLTSTGISANLDTYRNEASGVALIIDKAESMEDVQDQQQIFIDREPCVWERICAWLNYYGSRDLLDEDLVEFKDLDPEVMETINLKFGDAQPIMSETEKLNNITFRAKLGINTAIEILMKDDPSMTEEEALAKLTDLAADRVKNAAFWAVIAAGGAPAQASGTNKIDGGPGLNNQMDNATGDLNGKTNPDPNAIDPAAKSSAGGGKVPLDGGQGPGSGGQSDTNSQQS